MNYRSCFLFEKLACPLVKIAEAGVRTVADAIRIPSSHVGVVHKSHQSRSLLALFGSQRNLSVHLQWVANSNLINIVLGSFASYYSRCFY